MKLSAISMFRPAFKGYEYVKNAYGETCYYFNYPHDYAEEGAGEKCKLEIVKMDNEAPLWDKEFKFDVPKEGLAIDLFQNCGFTPKDKFMYRFLLINKDGNVRTGKDVGLDYVLKDDNDNVIASYTKASMSSLKPTVNGSGYLLMPDSFAPGYVFKGFKEENPDEIGKVDLDQVVREQAENSSRTFSNSYGGGLAGMIAKVPYLKGRGIKVLFGTPITGGDNISAFKYWPENLFQLAGGIGEMNNFEDFMVELYKNGMVYVMDAPLTSESYAGIHYQYALKWGDEDNQMKDWFRMEGIENNQVGYGIVGKASDGLRLYTVNAPHKFKVQNGQISYSEVNENFDPKKPTYIQYYDKDYVSQECVDKQQLLTRFDKMSADNPLKAATHDDTVVNLAVMLTKSDYIAFLKNIDSLNEINKKGKHKIDVDSKEATVYLSNLPRTNIVEKKENGTQNWDANTDMIKLRYFNSAADYKSDYKVPVDGIGMTAANNEIQDMGLKYGIYWTQMVKNIQNIYTAQALGDVKDAHDAKEKIDSLIKNGKLPAEAVLDLDALENIDNALYSLEFPETTANSLITKNTMNLIFESLPFAKDTLGVLSTSYFTPRAASYTQLGLSRYELDQLGNPQFTEYQNQRFEFQEIYEQVNALFRGDKDGNTGEVYDFVRAVLERVDEKMPEGKKIFEPSSEDGLTEYGYYVTKFIAEDAARYIMIKAFVPDAEAKITSKGQIIYDYAKLREESSLAQLGVKGNTPKYEAELLAKKMKAGLRNHSTNSADIDFVTDAVMKKFGNVNLNAFRYAEAMVDKAGLSLRHRIDALKDIEDIESSVNFNENNAKVQDNLSHFWGKFKEAIASIAPDSCIYDEITDKEKFKIDDNDKDPGMAFIHNSEHTTVAAYEYFFTNLLKIFAGEMDRDSVRDNYSSGFSYKGSKEREEVIDKSLKELFNARYLLDYFKSLYTFGGNHDKPRLNYAMFINPKLLFADINNMKTGASERNDALLMITGAVDMKDLPFDVMYNYNNVDYINANYFTGASNSAIAMGKVIRDNIHEKLWQNPQKKYVSEEELNSLHNAVTALVNGYYTKEPEKRPSHYTFESAFKEILDIASANGLSSGQTNGADVYSDLLKKVPEKAKALVEDRVVDHYNSGKIYHFERLKGEKPDYSLSNVGNQVLLLGTFLRRAADIELNAYQNKQEMYSKIDDAIKEYMSQFDEASLKRAVSEHEAYELSRMDDERNAFGARDLREAIRLVFAKAELNKKKDAQFHLFKSINDAAIAKVKMYTHILTMLPGVPTSYYGDEFSMSGKEEKAKNIDLQNRNATPFSKLEGKDEEAEYYRKINNEFREITKLRDMEELAPLNNGTPYYIHPVGGTTDHNDSVHLPATFTMGSDGSVVLSLFNLAGINSNPSTSVQEPYIVDLDEIKLATDNNLLATSTIAIAAGTVLTNIIKGDNTLYKVIKEGTDYFVRRFDENNKRIKIRLDRGTMKDCVFTLYHKVKKSKIHFKGGNRREYYNPQFNIVSNPYHYLSEHSKCGEKLSVIAK